MKLLMEKIIRLRNPSFRFDPKLNGMALFQFGWMQALNLFRSFRMLLYFRKPNGMMLGRGVRFFNLPRIQWGRFLKLGEYVSVSGLGTEGVTFGNNVGIGAFSRIIVSTSPNNMGSYIRIGNNVGIGEFAYLGGAGGLEIGDNCIVGQYFSCHPENHIYDNTLLLIREQGITRKGIQIGSNCWIGSKVTILDGVSVGSGCVIAAGAVVTRSFPPNSLIGGIPAKLLRSRVSDSQPNNYTSLNRIA